MQGFAEALAGRLAAKIDRWISASNLGEG